MAPRLVLFEPALSMDDGEPGHAFTSDKPTGLVDRRVHGFAPSKDFRRWRRRRKLEKISGDRQMERPRVRPDRLQRPARQSGWKLGIVG
jgi:hypothetical protein